MIVVDYTLLPPHYKISLSFKLTKIDAWTDEQILIYLDDSRIFTRKYQQDQGTNLCGNRDCYSNDQGTICNKDLVDLIEFTLPSDKPSIQLRISNDLNQGPEYKSFGLSDYYFYIYKCDVACASCTGEGSDKCTACAPHYYMYGGRCFSACPVGYGDSETQTCLPCLKNCKSCLSANDICLSCESGYLQAGECVEVCV